MRSDVWRTAIAGLMVLLIALVDWRVQLDVAFGFLYVFPLILVGTVLPRWQIACAALLCTVLADLFDPYPFVPSVSLPSDILVFSSLAGTGLFSHAVTRSRQLAREAEEQLEFLVQTSPAAILTMTEDGEIVLANVAAHHLLRAAPAALPGQNIRRYLPALAEIRTRADASRPIQSDVECRGQRTTGEGFLAEVFFSTYHTALGPRIATVIIDVSEALREREISGLDQLLAGSRILVGAVFHEVRNLASAIAINYETLSRGHGLVGNQSFEALGALIVALRRVSGAAVTESRKDSDATQVEVADVIDDLRLVLDPLCEEANITVRWTIQTDLPPVWADRHRLLQVLLNLMRNSERALADQEIKSVHVSAAVSDDRVAIRVRDTGPGLASTDHLFEPFQRGAESAGLGLYLSRALLRSFGGDLRHEATAPGCEFVIMLSIVRPDEERTPLSHEPHPLALG